MEEVETKLIKILEELKEKYFVKSIKLEFEAEGATFEEAELLKTLSQKTNLELTVKIGGCEAVRDIDDIKKLNADNIIAPMIESKYALKKFVKAVKGRFEETELQNKKLFINIESENGYKNLEEIISAEEFEKVNGIILGRSDMAGSLNLSKDKVNSEEIFNIAKEISLKMKTMNKKFIVGGGVFEDSLNFFKKLPYITEFETRKIIFDSSIFDIKNVNDGIKKAIEFEVEWLKAKQMFFNFSKEDSKRLNVLKNYLNNVIRLNI